jgi:SAM-dependent methyltransferase
MDELYQDQLERIMPTVETMAMFFERFPDHRQRYDLALDMINNGMLVADCASGAGYGTYLLSGKAQNVIGIDIADEALNHANKYFKLPNNKFIHPNEMGEYKMDFVVSFETLEHMDEDAGDEFLLGLRRILKPGGRILISTPLNKHKNKHNVTPFHIREYDDYEFPAKLEKNGFKIICMYGQGSYFHKKLYGKNKIGFSLFSVIKLGLHRILPARLREMIKNRFLGDSNNGLAIIEGEWRNASVQLALCEIAE